MIGWVSLSGSDTQPVLPRWVPLVTMMCCQPLFVGSLASVTWVCVLISRSKPPLALGLAGSSTTCVFFVVYFTSTVGKCSVFSPPEVLDLSHKPAILLKSEPPGSGEAVGASGILLGFCFSARFQPHWTAP